MIMFGVCSHSIVTMAECHYTVPANCLLQLRLIECLPRRDLAGDNARQHHIPCHLCRCIYILPASIYVNENDAVVKQFVCRVNIAAPFAVRCVKDEYFVLFLKKPQPDKKKMDFLKIYVYTGL